MNPTKIKLLLIVLIFIEFNTIAQTEGFVFKTLNEVPTSPVKDQQRTGTCWSFATTSFIETELIRMGQPIFDISEMYFVRHAYALKAKEYIRFQGANNFGQGGQAHDVLNVIREHGMVDETEYPGLNYDSDVHAHAELEKILSAFVETIVKNPIKKLSTAWFNAYNGILDAYLGKLPNKNVSPLANVGFNPDDYVELTSFSHHPYYKKVILEIPDNWSHNQYYNLPLDELMQVLKYAIENGFSVCWDGDVSEKSFAYSKGVAVLPISKVEELTGSDKDRWTNISKDDLSHLLANFDRPVPELRVTQENRQQNFENLTTTDDHLMHITGMATDQNGTLYFITKNSWGSDGVYKGFLYMSEAYVRMKTIAIMVHRKAIPQEIAHKLGI